MNRKDNVGNWKARRDMETWNQKLITDSYFARNRITDTLNKLRLHPTCELAGLRISIRVMSGR